MVETRNQGLEHRMDRVEKSIEKLTEISQNVSSLLAVQNVRLEQSEKLGEKMGEMIEKRREEANQDTRILHERISSAEKQSDNKFNALDKKLDSVQVALVKKMDDLNQTASDRLGRLEKWVWSVSGGGLVIGFIVSQIFDFIK